MKDLSQIIYNFRKLRAKRKYNHQLQEEEIYKIRHGHERRKLTTGKLCLFVLIANCFIVQLYAMILMPIMHDLSPLITIVGSLVAEMSGICGYFIKATKENTEGGITFETAKSNDFNAVG